jgi:hypothetical protein
MTNFEADPHYEPAPDRDPVEALNLTQALELLDIKRLRSKGLSGPLARERFIMNNDCFMVLRDAGLFGQDAHVPPGLVLTTDASFGQLAAFLDLASVWTTCDELYVFLGRQPQKVTRPVDRFINRWLDPIFSKLLAAGLPDDHDTLRGFFTYVDLSVDSLCLVDNEQCVEGAEWYRRCFARWYSKEFADLALTYISILAPEIFEGPPEKAPLWAMRLRAVKKLRDEAQKDDIWMRFTSPDLD